MLIKSNSLISSFGEFFFFFLKMFSRKFNSKFETMSCGADTWRYSGRWCPIRARCEWDDMKLRDAMIRSCPLLLMKKLKTKVNHFHLFCLVPSSRWQILSHNPLSIHFLGPTNLLSGAHFDSFTQIHKINFSTTPSPKTLYMGYVNLLI